MERDEFLAATRFVLDVFKSHHHSEPAGVYILEDQRIFELCEFRYESSKVKRILSFLEHVKILIRQRQAGGTIYTMYVTTSRGKEVADGAILSNAELALMYPAANEAAVVPPPTVVAGKKRKPGEYGKWSIDESLVEGGQAHTFIVYDSSAGDDRKFVLKRLKNLNRKERFKKEIDACKKLDHPGILKVVDSDIDGKKPYLIAEHCALGSLENIHTHNLTIQHRLTIFLKIAEAVAHAHTNGITHRDLKPDNIFLKDGFIPIVGDFGICFVDDDGHRNTATEEAVGPRYYMAPELEEGRVETVTPASDIYSLGKVLYFLLSNNVFAREKHREANYNLTKFISNHEAAFVNKLLDKMIVATPEGRFKDANELVKNYSDILVRIDMRGHVIDKAEKQPCNYCVKGHYQIVVDTTKGDVRNQTNMLNNFGIQNTGRPLIIAICDFCGNTQFFREENAKTWGSPDVW